MIARLFRALVYSIPPVFVALYVGATTFSGASFAPWRPLMVDLDVYRLAGTTLLQGGDYYDLPGPLQFLYPPFAAVLAVPLALIPLWLAQIGWTAAGALALLAVLYRFGLSGWVLSLVGTACMFFIQPVVQTLAFGQLGIFLVALVVLDLAPGPRILPRRLLPEGALTAVAAAIKLTPAIFVVYLLLAGKRRAFVVSVITGAAVTALAWIITPASSTAFWTRLAHGDTGLGNSIIYYTNQSVLADVVRLFGLGAGPSRAGLIASAVVAALGVWAAVLWHRVGDVRLAVTLCGVAGLLASPVSWQHHFVWVIPLALCLVERRTVPLPTPMLALGWIFVGWVAAAPRGLTDESRRLPNGADVELTWGWTSHAVASFTALVGTALLIAAIVVARRLRRTRPGEMDVTAGPGRPDPAIIAGQQSRGGSSAG